MYIYRYVCVSRHVYLVYNFRCVQWPSWWMCCCCRCFVSFVLVSWLPLGVPDGSINVTAHAAYAQRADQPTRRVHCEPATTTKRAQPELWEQQQQQQQQQLSRHWTLSGTVAVSAAVWLALPASVFSRGAGGATLAGCSYLWKRNSFVFVSLYCACVHDAAELEPAAFKARHICMCMCLWARVCVRYIWVRTVYFSNWGMLSY